MNIHTSLEGLHAPNRKRIAVIGSGISGISAAWSLNFTHDVTLYERDARAGGHTCTVGVDYDGRHIPVDVGFIVFNERNYPNLCALFEHLGVASEETNMSFSLSLDRGRREWSGQDFRSLFAQKRNIASPAFLWMLREILRFNRAALADKASGFTDDLSIGEYLARRRFSARFRDDYLIPMAAAIWSTPKVKMMDFPANSFIRFFENHRLLEIVPPQWRTVSGGSRNYHAPMLATLGENALVGTGVTGIERPASGGVIITDDKGHRTPFDAVVIATHTDQALAMLQDACDDERSILSSIAYKPNRVILHRDETLMPKRRRAWAAWNYLREDARGDESEICLTYWMNRLQNIDNATPLFVTLNPHRDIDPSKIFGEWTFDHPQYDAASFDAQTRLKFIQGRRDTFYAGAWTGYGFHEDGLRSGLEAAEALGGYIPWRHTAPDLPMPIAAE